MPNPMVGVRVPPDWFESLTAIAQSRGGSVADVAREAIGAFLGKTDIADISDIKQPAQSEISDIRNEVTDIKQAIQADITDIRSDIANLRTGFGMLTERVAQFEKRAIAAIPQQAAPGKVTLENFTPQDIQPELDAAIDPSPSATLPAPQPLGKGKGIWYTLPDAFQLAQSRGYQGPTVNAFRSWAKRNPALLRERYGLVWHGAGQKDSKSPSYEDIGIKK